MHIEEQLDRFPKTAGSRTDQRGHPSAEEHGREAVYHFFVAVPEMERLLFKHA